MLKLAHNPCHSLGVHRTWQAVMDTLEVVGTWQMRFLNMACAGGMAKAHGYTPPATLTESRRASGKAPEKADLEPVPRGFWQLPPWMDRLCSLTSWPHRHANR